MEGPQFSTRAESNLYRSWGADIIGMTNLQEAKLAREAEICYATMAMVTDYDCWHDGHDAVTVDQVVAVLHQNSANAAMAVKACRRRHAQGAHLRLRDGAEICHPHQSRSHSSRNPRPSWICSCASTLPESERKTMSILVVGSVAFDTIETPKGKRDRCLGGAATYFALSASYFTDVRVIAVVGEDFHRGARSRPHPSRSGYARPGAHRGQELPLDRVLREELQRGPDPQHRAERLRDLCSQSAGRLTKTANSSFSPTSIPCCKATFARKCRRSAWYAATP